jgi:hypothetical protein
VPGSTGAAVPFYDLTFSATKSVSLLQASYAATAAAARERGDTATAGAYEAKVTAIAGAAIETARQVIALPSGRRASCGTASSRCCPTRACQSRRSPAWSATPGPP